MQMQARMKLTYKKTHETQQSMSSMWRVRENVTDDIREGYENITIQSKS